MKEIIQNYNSILEQIRIAADEANRDMNEIKLIVVTKKFEAENIKPLLDIGHLYYGENKVQEAARKWFDLKSEYKEIKLSLIGPLQTNKIKLALDLFCSIHSIDREKLVLKLSQYPEKIKNIDESLFLGGKHINPLIFKNLFALVNNLSKLLIETPDFCTSSAKFT